MDISVSIVLSVRAHKKLFELIYPEESCIFCEPICSSITIEMY